MEQCILALVQKLREGTRHTPQVIFFKPNFERRDGSMGEHVESLEIGGCSNVQVQSLDVERSFEASSN